VYLRRELSGQRKCVDARDRHTLLDELLAVDFQLQDPVAR
jgi:hypothetical protein